MKTCHTLIVSTEKKEGSVAETQGLEEERKGETEEGFVLQWYKCGYLKVVKAG